MMACKLTIREKEGSRSFYIFVSSNGMDEMGISGQGHGRGRNCELNFEHMQFKALRGLPNRCTCSY